MPGPTHVEEVTELPRVTARVLGGDVPPFSVRVNRALARRLALRHRVVHRLSVPRVHPERAAPPPSPEQKLLQSTVGPQPPPPPDGELVATGASVKRYEVLVRHRSGVLSFTGAERGEVESVTREAEGLPEGLAERITVIVGWPGPLQVGDVLHADDAALGVVERIDDDGVDEPRVWLPGASPGATRTLERRLPTATQGLEARGIGPYSIVTQRPLDGVRVRPEQIAWLAEHGARALAGEFPTYKSGDPVMRMRAFEALCRGEPLADPWSALRPASSPSDAAQVDGLVSSFEGPPEGLTLEPLRVLERHFRVLGIGLEIDGHDLRVLLRLPDGPEAWSRGEVNKPETVNHRTLEPEPGGLFCQKIFGPVRDHECACGKYARREHRGVMCEHCGVEVLPSAVRRERFGHIALSSPVVPRHLRRLVTALLGERSKVWLASLDDDGGASLRARLASIDPDARARALPPGSPARARVEALAAAGIPPLSLLWEVLPVLPPSLRPLVPLPGGRWATSDLNDLYRRVVNRSNRLRRLIELNAPDILIRNERNRLRISVDQLLFNGSKGVPAARFGGRTLRSVFGIAREMLRPVPAGQRSDFSGAATALVEERSRAAVPLAILYEIAKPLLYERMEREGLAQTIRAAKTRLEADESLRRRIVGAVFAERPLVFGNALLGPALAAAETDIGEDPVVRLPSAVAARIGVRTGGRVAIHLPLSAAGVEEARALARGEMSRAPIPRRGWVDEIARLKKGAAVRLVDLALQRAEDPCESPHAAGLVGGWVLSP